MSFSELSEIIAKETGVSICPICGVPFKKYHYRQITCASPECKKAHRAEYLKNRTARLREEDIDLYRQKHNEAQRKCRRKKKGITDINEGLKKAQDYWERQEQKHQLEKPDGKEYADRQIERTLSKVPKIDVNGFKKERK